MNAALPVYRGPFGREQAERLLWRAGFGPRKGEADALAAKGLEAAVRSLTRPPAAETLIGPEPRDSAGNPLAPTDAFGHDHAWWLDKMARSSRPLVERMTLVWHDWFATSNAGVGSQQLMIAQNELLRRFALGSFKGLATTITSDPAMLIWLSGYRNEERAPNENYGRELMELFTLGASNGYTEDDVREQARALTGWRADFQRGVGFTNFRFDPARHDRGVKRVFGRSGRFDWKDACRLCIEHPRHARFFVTKLWSYFVPTAPDAATVSGLLDLYVGGRYRLGPVLEGILRHPDLYGPARLVKPPAVYSAGMVRAIGKGVRDGELWASLGNLAGQRLFYPPNVAGWDDSRWLDTATYRGRFNLASLAVRREQLDPRAPAPDQPVEAAALVARAAAYWGSPSLGTGTVGALRSFAAAALGDARRGQESATAATTENALRVLVAVSPDYLAQ